MALTFEYSLNIKCFIIGYLKVTSETTGYLNINTK